MTVAIVTCRIKPEPDPDEAPLVSALSERGVNADVVAWDDEGVDWGRFQRAILRSTWNYIHDLPAFLAWMERTSEKTFLENPPSIVRDNVDKIYLRALEQRGVPVTPTWFIAKDEPFDFEAEIARRGWSDVVVKPRVGAASFMTRRFQPGRATEGAAFLRDLTTRRDAMVQPYIGSVEGYGERALVWIAGQLTHAVRKSPRLALEDERVSEALDIAPEERRLADEALAPLVAAARTHERSELLYARVDLVRDDAGAPMLMELELCEPSLFLVQHPPALARLADAIAERQRSGSAQQRRPTS
jgi:glutathione synthase/RimK-type ligase-like ATP-grasp enzyme